MIAKTVKWAALLMLMARFLTVHCDCVNSTIFKLVNARFPDNVSLDTPVYTYPDVLKNILFLKGCTDYFKINGTDVFPIVDFTKHCDVSTVNCIVECKTPSGGFVSQDLYLSRDTLPTGNISFKKTTYSADATENISPLDIYDFSEEINRTDCYKSADAKLKILANDSGPFEFFFNIIRLKTGAQLDYELKNHYTVQIGYEEDIRSATTDLIIHVIDVDDMDPVFNQSDYTYEVYENSVDLDWKETSPAIAAYDKDLGQGRQNLSFSSIDSGLVFDINPINGTIKIIQELDREYKSEYKYKIKVAQDNNPRRSATADLTIRVLDVNDNLPEFLNPPVPARIDEHSSRGTYVCRIFAADNDANPFDKTTYRFANATEIFFIEDEGYMPDKGNAGIIKVNDSNKLDREELGDILYLMVVAVDATNETDGGNTTVIIHLTDINDNTPKFQEPSYTFFVNNTLGKVGQVIATDNDSQLNGNGKILYTIPQPISDVQINNISGDIGITRPIFENIEFYVEACDNPNQQSQRRCSRVLVTLSVKPNDTVNSVMHANISENVSPGTIVMLIEVKGNHRFKLIGEKAPFTIDELSGIISTSGDIDRENGTSEYMVLIHILSNTWVFENITLYIEVLDVNDNAPVYEKTDYFFFLPEDLYKGHLIGRVNASDMDTGQNGMVMFSQPDTIISSYFNVNSTTGEIFITNGNLPAGKELFQLMIVATDRGSPPLKSSCNVYISRTVVENTLVRISTSLEASVLKSQRREYQLKLSDIILLSVTIEEVKPLEVNLAGRGKRSTETSQMKTKSFMYISATNATGSRIPSNDLQRLVLQHMEAIQALFMQPTTTLAKSSESSFKASEIALVVVAVVILIGAILVILIVFKIKSKQPMEKQTDSSIDEVQDIEPIKDGVSMQSIEVSVELGDEREQQSDTSDYEGSRHSNDQTVSESNEVGFINSAYDREEETVLKSDLRKYSTTDEAERQLNQLNDMLNQEEDRSPRPDYEIVDTLTENSKSVPVTDYENVGDNVDSVQEELYPPKPDYENIDPPKENTSSDTNAKILGEANHHELDRKNYENVSDTNERDDENTEDEPDVDYNDKQVRFSATVLDTEENKFEPLKSENDQVENNDNQIQDETEIGEPYAESHLTEQVDNECNGVSDNDNVVLLEEEEITAF